MKVSECDLPKEWMELVKEAMTSNITKESFKMFLKKEKEKKTVIYPDNFSNKN